MEENYFLLMNILVDKAKSDLETASRKKNV